MNSFKVECNSRQLSTEKLLTRTTTFHRTCSIAITVTSSPSINNRQSNFSDLQTNLFSLANSMDLYRADMQTTSM